MCEADLQDSRREALHCQEGQRFLGDVDRCRRWRRSSLGHMLPELFRILEPSTCGFEPRERGSGETNSVASSHSCSGRRLPWPRTNCFSVVTGSPTTHHGSLAATQAVRSPAATRTCTPLASVTAVSGFMSNWVLPVVSLRDLGLRQKPILVL